MTRKDNEKDADRPHYYSQFWLDIAAGRRTIGGPRPDEDEPDDDLPELEPEISAPRRASRNGQEYSSYNGRQEQHDEDEQLDETPVAQTRAEPIATVTTLAPETEAEPDAAELAPQAINDLDLQEAAVEDENIPDLEFEQELAPEPEEDEDTDEEFYDEEDEDDEWGGGKGRKKPKPTRATKQPVKRPKRDSRRGGY